MSITALDLVREDLNEADEGSVRNQVDRHVSCAALALHDATLDGLGNAANEIGAAIAMLTTLQARIGRLEGNVRDQVVKEINDLDAATAPTHN